ncbi:L-alanine exporter AlaE [Marivita sp.]|uniref:L-alanine exporter AlaE n=1 Tax=Marivita sp. TaxID=2003365 RepID=UPI003F6C79FA
MKAFVVDTLVTVTFFTFVAGLTEFFIAGMEMRQVVIARLVMVPVMILTGRPYGLWRDWVLLKTRAKRKVTTILADVFAFLTFQVPVYVATLLVAGASLAEIKTAVGAAILFMILLSRPFGLFLEWVRHKVGTNVQMRPVVNISPTIPSDGS